MLQLKKIRHNEIKKESKMSDAVVVRTRKFKRNPLLARRQMIVDIVHPGRANVPKSDLQEQVGGMYKADPKLTVLFDRDSRKRKRPVGRLSRRRRTRARRLEVRV